ncbi:MAG: Fe(3+) ABC transporter substrate-binding protein [Prochlorotrichaceae cyanobacterium]
MNQQHRWPLFLTGLLGLSLWLGGCTSNTPTPQTGEETAPAEGSPTEQTEAAEVNIYSGRHYETDKTLYDRFTADTGIQVNIVEGDADELQERILAEGERTPADLLITVDAGRLWRAEEAGLFQPVQSEILESSIPEALRQPDGLWFGLTQRARVLVYNPEKVQSTELSTYEALAEPQWQGRVCIRSSNNIYNQSLLGSMVETLGVEATEAWARGLAANLARDPEGGDTDQIKAVAAGQCDVAIANHYYWARLAKSDKPEDQAVAKQTAIFFPNQDDRGTHVNISGAGVLANAKNPEAAVTLLEFLVSPEAQKVFAEGNNEYPVVAGVEIDPVVAALGEAKFDQVNVSAYGRNNPEVVKLVDRVGWK